MTILEALDDPALFGPHFKGATWTAWRVFLAALFALGFDDAAGSYLAATGRQNWPAAPFDEAALMVGRRGGKSRILALIAVFLACFRVCPLSRARRGRDGRDPRGKPPAGAHDLSIHLRTVESRPAARADDRGSERREDIAKQSRRD